MTEHTAPWDFSSDFDPKPGKKLVPNLPTEAGAALGVEFARLTAPALEQSKQVGHPPPCVECAFVKGTEPNQCGPTLMDAIKCVVEVTPFYCHMGVVGGEPKRLCAGFMAAMASREKLALIVKASEALVGEDLDA
jgi:hypothetical protein